LRLDITLLRLIQIPEKLHNKSLLIEFTAGKGITETKISSVFSPNHANEDLKESFTLSTQVVIGNGAVEKRYLKINLIIEVCGPFPRFF
jgi:hypothetical protein